MTQGVIYLIDGMVVMTAVLGVLFWILLTRRRYAQLALTHIIAEFWPERGRRYALALEVHEEKEQSYIEAPHGTGKHDIGQYFFQRANMYIDKWPRVPPLGVSWTQADFGMVSWRENNPNPIDPYHIEAALTAKSLFNLRDNDFLVFVREAEEKIKDLQERLAKALINQIPKNLLLLMLIGSIGINIVCIVLLVKYGALITTIAQALGIM
jgi:hypothetical protein